LGFDGVWTFDHFKPMYGEGPGPCFEAWTTMAALAAATERVRIGCLVSGLTYRHPSVLAAEAVTIDHVSHGRLELALGAAWYEQEHRELGIPFPPTGERIARFEEALQVIRLLMTTDDAPFAGKYLRLEKATYRPRPVQQPTPPLWIGAGGPRMLGIAARCADVWHTFGPPGHVKRLGDQLAEKAARAGRDPGEIAWASNLSISEQWDEVRRNIDGYTASGVSYLVVGWPGEGAERVEEFAREFLG
jgi:alkanesulfonate monooxygenase SsuD/methylene tetrahydromethanopterin reductase-like flavin-dependent oxidoreductase (luciferase family)